MLHNVGMLELVELGHLHQMMAKPGYFSYPSDLGTASSWKVEIGEMGLGSVIKLVRQKASGSETQTQLQ